MIYTLKRDDMPSLSQWIKKEVTFGRQKLLLFWWIRGGLLSPAGSFVISLPVVVSASHRSRKNSLVFCDDCHTLPLPSSPTGCGRGRFQPGSSPFTIICQTKKVSDAHLFCLRKNDQKVRKVR